MEKVSHPARQLSPSAWQWFSYRPSLTQRLRELTGNRISFDVINQTFKSIENQSFWYRHIQWRMENKLWIDAKLTIPKDAITDKTKNLLDINERPIGELLFKDPDLDRTPFEYFKDTQNKTWIRRSTFHYKRLPITLTETFLPAFFMTVERANMET